MKKRFYHITHKDLGDSILFKPCVPVSRGIKEDDKIERICVGRTIQEALIGREGLPSIEHLRNKGYAKYLIKDWIYILETDNWIIPTLKQVPQSKYTNEHWILNPTIGFKLRNVELTDFM